ncbi:Haloacid dehalogenase-like hydrolase (HAD) superfamily protein [Abeliophyllum distichum]|uniref:Mitochondrial import inner membrane translocase subunit TIM50 n=1 Tax=Abeliophyllum distichum TaxID=126358 RepID=A0ABD1RHL5_9LAMI
MADEPSNLKLKNVVSDDSKESAKDIGNDSDLPLEKLNLGPKRKLLVLCLGGLLVNRVHIKHWTRVQGLDPDVRNGNFVVFKRPFCTEFMKFCFERFEVGIWSASTERNTDAILDCVTGAEMKNKLAFVWGQEECIDSGIQCLKKRLKPLFLKDLRQLWNKKYLDLPWRRGQYSWSNTLLICVDPPTSLLNPPNTAIFPQPYKRHDSKDTFLGPNGELQGYLDGLADVDNVPSYVKEHPFGQPAITPSHLDWNYYAKIVREFGKEEEYKSTSK